MVDIAVQTNSGTTTITATANHPFWAADLQEWVEAGNLAPGTKLLTDRGEHTQVVSVRHHTELASVHNLTVADIHTYYVLAGNTPVLVHNAGCDPLKLEVIEARASGFVAAERNIAAAELTIGDSSDLFIAASGSADRAGFVPGVGAHNPQRFIPTASGNNTRINDSEFKLLNHIANRLGQSSNVSGTLRIYSESPVCSSCSSVISQFKEAYPHINIVVVTG